MAEKLHKEGYQQIIERKVEVPIRDMEKPKQLKFLEEELSKKETQLKAELSHLKTSTEY